MIQQAPTANRYVEDAQTERQYKMHVQNVKKMKPSINTHADQKVLDKAKLKNPRVRIFDGQNAMCPAGHQAQVKKTKAIDKPDKRPKTAVPSYRSTDSINNDFDQKNSTSFEDDFEIDIFSVDPTKQSSQRVLNEKDDIKPKKKIVHKIPVRTKTAVPSKKTTLGPDKPSDIIRKQPSNSSLSNAPDNRSNASSRKPERNITKKVPPKTDSARRKIKNSDSDLSANYTKPKANIPLANQQPKLLMNKQSDRITKQTAVKKKVGVESSESSITKEKKGISKKVISKPKSKPEVFPTAVSVSKVKENTDNDGYIRKINSDNTLPCMPIVSEEKPKITFGADMWDTDDEEDSNIEDDHIVIEDNLLNEINSDNESKNDSIVHDDFVCSDDFSSENDF